MLPWLAPASPERLNDLRDTTLSKLVRDDVLAQILGGALAPGQRINEPDVAARLKVSRVPVREALRELESAGLVVARKNAGAFVRELDADEVRDLYELRALLDAYAGRRAARLPEAPRAALVKTLRASVATMEAAAARHEVPTYYRENLRFHWAIVESLGNGAIAQAYRGVVEKLHLSRLKNLSQDLGMRVSIAEHAQIAAALEHADPGCEALMSRHVETAYLRLAAPAR